MTLAVRQTALFYWWRVLQLEPAKGFCSAWRSPDVPSLWGLATAVSMLRLGATSGRALTTISGIALLPLGEAAIGAFVTILLSGAWLAAILAFTCAALLYLIAEELLVEAHKSQQPEHENAFTTAVFFAGFLAILILDISM